MGRPCTTGKGKRRKQYKRLSVEYGDKKAWLDYLDKGHTVKECIKHFCGELSRKDHRAKEKLISKWKKAAVSIKTACESGRAGHHNARKLGDGTVLSKEAEDGIVQWINGLRQEGVPVSRFMLETEAKQVAAEYNIPSDKFSALASWMQLFMRRHELSLRTKTRQGQTTPQDAAEAARKFRALVLRTTVEQNCTQIYNADQTAVFFEYAPKKTVDARGTKTVWVKCANKDKQRATAMLLGDSCGTKYDPFIIFKSTPAKTTKKQVENNLVRHGFDEPTWREVSKLQQKHLCQIYGNKTAWWNTELSLKFLEFHFSEHENRDDKVLLLWDDFSAHWTPEVTSYVASLNVVLLKIPPRYTYVCQPADISWNKPFKGLVRSLWIDRLKAQLATYNKGEKQRQEKREKLAAAILRARKTLDQQEADKTVAELREQHKEKAFSLVGSSRPDMTKWITSSWFVLSTSTMPSVFSRAGLLMDNRVMTADETVEADTDSVIQSLERYNLAEKEIDSDDDIGSECSCSDSED